MTLEQRLAHQGRNETIDLLGKVIFGPVTLLGYSVYIAVFATLVPQQRANKHAPFVKDVRLHSLYRLK